MRPALPLLLTAALSLRADALTDLRTALKGLPATHPVQASVDCQVWSRSGGGKQPKIVQGRAQARLEDGPAGLKLGWDRAELARVEAAGKAKDEGPGKALQALGIERAESLLDAATALLQDLDGAQIQEDRPEAWQGHPARLLVLKLEPKDLDADDRKHLKSFSRILKVWLGPDGLPLAASEQMDMKLSVMFIGVELHHAESRAFVRVGDRLVATHDEAQDSGSGAGQQGDQRTVLDLRF
ncbi:MAG TPA: hypothetical protein VFM16_06820 [Holophagaceae bacterium]|nr:hypothetical protein [Holophagaceae bacterium]